jgi:hypothetical protein
MSEQTDLKRERSTKCGQYLAEDWDFQELLWPGISMFLIEQAALNAWTEVVGGQDLYADEFVLGFKARATELTRD